LRASGFEPILFKRRARREKGVDIALTKEMLVNSFNRNFNVGILVAGDEDYVGLVNEVKRYGPGIWGTFFDHGVSDELFITFDNFIKLGNRPTDRERWEGCIQKIVNEARESGQK